MVNVQFLLKDLVDSQSVILEYLVTVELPLKRSFKLLGFVEKVEEEVKKYNKLKDELLTKFGEEVEGKKGAYMVKPDNIEKFESKMSELDNTTVELNLPKVTFKELGVAKISTAKLKFLRKFVKEE